MQSIDKRVRHYSKARTRRERTFERSCTVWDFTSGHYKNCALHESYLTIYFGVTPVGIALALVWTGRHLPYTRFVARKALIFLLLTLILQWLSCLCSIFLEQGSFIAGMIFQGLWATTFQILVCYLLHFLTSPAFAIVNKPFREFEKRLQLLVAICLGIISLLLVVVSDSVLRSQLHVFLLFMISILLSGYGAYIYVQATSLLKLINTTEENVRNLKNNLI